MVMQGQATLRLRIPVKIHWIFCFRQTLKRETCTWVHIPDCGRKPQSARVLMQGVPVFSIIDTAADITIMGATLFQKVAA